MNGYEIWNVPVTLNTRILNTQGMEELEAISAENSLRSQLLFPAQKDDRNVYIPADSRDI